VDAVQAVAAAKSHLMAIFANEIIGEPRTDEVWLDEENDQWAVRLKVT
jgi:hypothetical protein